EPAAAPRTRFNPDLPAHAFDTLSHDCEPDPGSGILLAPVKPFKYAKDSFLVFLLDANPVVFHPEAHDPISGFRADVQDRRTARSNELRPIAQQIRQHL